MAILRFHLLTGKYVLKARRLEFAEIQLRIAPHASQWQPLLKARNSSYQAGLLRRSPHRPETLWQRPLSWMPPSP